MKIPSQSFVAGSVAVCAIVFLFLFGFGNFSLGPKEFMRQIGSAVGASAGVAANEYNTLAQSLLKKESEVSQKEKMLAEREAVVLQEGNGKDTRLVFVVLSVGILLLLLILLNFYLDYRRKSE